MPTEAELKLQAMKDRYFGNPVDTTYEERYRNFGKAAHKVSQQYITGDNRKTLYDMHKTGKYTGSDLFRGNMTSQEAAEFGGIRTMAQWLLIAENPTVRYADLMDPNKFQVEKQAAGGLLTQAMVAFHTTGNKTPLLNISRKCMQRVGRMNYKDELSYAMGIDPNLSPDEFRAAAEANPVLCGALMKSMSTNAQNTFQVFNGLDPARVSKLTEPVSENTSDFTKAILQHVPEDELAAYSRGLGRMRVFNAYFALGKATGDNPFEKQVDAIEHHLDVIAEDGTMSTLSGAERFITQFSTGVASEGMNVAQVEEVLHTDLNAMFAGKVDHPIANFAEIAEITTLPSMAEAESFAKFAQITAMVDKTMTVGDLIQTEGRAPAYAENAKSLATYMMHGRKTTRDTAALYADTLSIFNHIVQNNPIQLTDSTNEAKLGAELFQTSLTADLLNHGVRVAKDVDVSKENGLSRAFKLQMPAGELETMAETSKGFAALEELQRCALDSTRSLDERIIARETIQTLKPVLNGKTPAEVPNMAELVEAHASVQRNIMHHDSNMIDEKKAEAYLRGEMPYKGMINPKQAFRSLPPVSKETVLPVTLKTTDDPQASDKPNAAQLYKLGQKPALIGTDAALRKAGCDAFDAHFGHLNQAARANQYLSSGLQGVEDTFFIDGMSVDDYAKKLKLPTSDIGVKKSLIMSVLASGEHHVEKGTLGMDEKGNYGVNVSTVNMDISALDGQEGMFSRLPSKRTARLEQNDTQRAARQEAVKVGLEERFAAGIAKKLHDMQLRENPQYEQDIRFSPAQRESVINGADTNTQYMEPLTQKALEHARDTKQSRDGDKRDVFRGAPGELGGLNKICMLHFMGQHPEARLEDLRDPEKFKAEKLAAGKEVTDAYLDAVSGNASGYDAMAQIVAKGKKTMSNWDLSAELKTGLGLPDDASKDELRAAMAAPENAYKAAAITGGISQMGIFTRQALNNLEYLAPAKDPYGKPFKGNPVADRMAQYITPAENETYNRASLAIRELGTENAKYRDARNARQPLAPPSDEVIEQANFQRECIVEYGAMGAVPLEQCAAIGGSETGYPKVRPDPVVQQAPEVAPTVKAEVAPTVAPTVEAPAKKSITMGELKERFDPSVEKPPVHAEQSDTSKKAVTNTMKKN